VPDSSELPEILIGDSREAPAQDRLQRFRDRALERSFFAQHHVRVRGVWGRSCSRCDVSAVMCLRSHPS